MTISQWIIIAIISFPLLLAILGRLRMDISALLIGLFLAIAQLAGFEVFGPANQPHLAINAFSGFSQEAVITLVSIFILTAGLEKSGFARWISKQLLKIGGNSIRKLIFLFASTAAFLSLFMNDVAAAALLIPSVMEVSRRTKINPGKLLIPVSYGSLLGGMATYFATANILANSLLMSASPSQEPLTILSFFPTGGLIALVGILFLTFFGSRLLPAREQNGRKKAKRLTGSELERSYKLMEHTWKISIHKKSPFCGKTLKEIGLGENYGLVLAALRSKRQSFLYPSPDTVLEPGYQLLVIGRKDHVEKLAGTGVNFVMDDKSDTLSKRGLAICELLVLPRSGAVGKNLKDLDFRKRFGWSVIALQRGGDQHRTDVGSLRLAVGDSLLVVGESSRKEALSAARDFILLDSSPSDQPIQLRETILSVGLLGSAIVASLFGIPIYIAVLVAALIAILSGTVTMQEAYRTIEWQVIFIVGSMYSVSLALVQSGLAASAGSVLARLADAFGPIGLAGGAFLVASLLSQIMGGQFEMLMTGPIAISAAIQYGISPQAVALAVAIGCSNSFLTPMAHPANLLMMAPGGYKFSDFPKIGWWLFVLSFITLLAGLVLFWGF